MADNNVCNQLLDLWDEVSKNWSADAKSKYKSSVFDEMMGAAQSVYANNRKLQAEAEACCSLCGIHEENY